MQQRRQDPRIKLQRSALQPFDPFMVNPLRRSLIAIAVSGAIVVGPPLFLSADHAALVLVSVGWLAMAVLVLSLPVLLIALVEQLYRAVSRRIHPSVDDLELSPRVRNLLRRHDFSTIASLDRTSDASLLLLSNFDARAVQEVRRAVSLWKYRRWQEAGFPARGRWNPRD
jgi:hypothetical protein